MARGLTTYEEARQQRQLWTPALLPARPLVLLDARDAASPASWFNKGSAGDFAQATSGTQPALVPNAVNGRPLLNFATSKHQETAAQTISGVTDVTVLTLGIFSTAATKAMVSIGWNTGNSYIGWAVYTGQGVGNSNGAFTPLLQFDSTAIRDGKPHSQTLSFGSASGRAWLDGAAVTPTGNTPLGLGTITSQSFFVCQADPAELGDHQMGIVVVAPGALSTSDVARLTGWAHWEYGLQGLLPVGHPYKNRPPMIGA